MKVQEPLTHEPLTVTESREGGFDLLEFLVLLASRKKLILGVTGALFVLSIVIALTMSPRFKAEVQVVPPMQDESAASSIGAMLGAPTGKSQQIADMCVGVLASRTVQDELIKKFNLMEIYKTKTMDDTRDVLSGNTDVNTDKSGIISIDVFDRDPKRAADMANTYSAVMNRVVSRIQTGDAAQRRTFYEHEAAVAKTDLANEEANLRQVQEKTGVVDLGGRLQQTLGAESGLRAQLAVQEADVRALSSYLTPNNRDLQMAQQRAAALRSELEKVRAGSGDETIALHQLPAKSQAYVTAYREVKYREAFYEEVLRMLENAKIDELKATDAVQVVDTAVPPERRVSPKRTLIVLMGTVFGLFLGIFLAAAERTYRRLMEDPERRGKVERIRWEAGV